MKKKLFSILLIASLLTVAACGKEDSKENVFNEVTSDRDVSHFTGELNGQVYENKYFGIGCKLDDEWTYMSEEQIEANNKQAVDMVGDDYKAYLEKADTLTLTDMAATYSNQMDSVNVGIEKVAASSANITEKQYAEITLNSVEGMLESMGLTISRCESGTEEFLGEEHAVVYIDGTYAGMEMHEKLYVIKDGQFFMSICASAWMDSDIDAIFACFYKTN